MNNKVITYTKVDLWDKYLKQKKNFRSLLKAKEELLLMKEGSGDDSYLVKSLLFDFKKTRSNVLNYHAKNSKNIFLRIKRKSSYGKTLLEKKKIQSYLLTFSSKEFKRYYQRYKHRLHQGIVSRIDYILTPLYRTIRSLRRDLILANGFYINGIPYDKKIKNLEVGDTLSFLQSSIDSSFDRSFPSHLHYDIRLGKVSLLYKESQQNPYPFFSDFTKVLQHFRLKRA